MRRRYFTLHFRQPFRNLIAQLEYFVLCSHWWLQYSNNGAGLWRWWRRLLLQLPVEAVQHMYSTDYNHTNTRKPKAKYRSQTCAVLSLSLTHTECAVVSPPPPTHTYTRKNKRERMLLGRHRLLDKTNCRTRFEAGGRWPQVKKKGIFAETVWTSLKSPGIPVRYGRMLLGGGHIGQVLRTPPPPTPTPTAFPSFRGWS